MPGPGAPRAFSSFPLDPRLLGAVEALGYERATPVQAAAIEVLLDGRDVIARARTGSGKTAAFGLPLLHRIAHPTPGEEQRGVQAIVLAPTRELALQVSAALKGFGRDLPGLRVATVYGGASYGPQLHALKRGAQLVVGTPGRVVDLVERGALDLGRVRMFVLDEADEMLKMGFVDEVEMLLGRTPPGRQVMLLSASMPAAIAAVARRHLRDPVEIRTETEALAVDHVEQRYIIAPNHKKTEALWRLLVGMEREAALVFARTRAACALVAEELVGRGLQVEALHGDLNQPARELVLGKLRRRQVDVVIATDIAARGIDVDHISHVINFDRPETKETYAHRIGRTGRAGRAGVAVTFVQPAELRRVGVMERTLGVEIRPMDVPSDADIRHHRLRQIQRDMAVALQQSGAAHELVDGLRREGGWSERQIAVAALKLLAGEGDALRGHADERPPAWSLPPRERRPRRPDGRDMVEIFIAAGRLDEVRAGHIVGALAHQGDVPGEQIGRVTVLDRKSFVALPRPVAEALVRDMHALELRGQEVAIGPARSRPPQRPGQGGRRRPAPRDGGRPPRRFTRGKGQGRGPPPRRKGPGIGKRGH